MVNSVSFGTWVKRRRTTLGMTQQELAALQSDYITALVNSKALRLYVVKRHTI